MKDLLIKIANDNKVEQSNQKLKQTYGRALKTKLNNALNDLLESELTSELVQVASVSNGVGVAIDNEKVGYISFEVVIVVKGLEYDLQEEHDYYMRELQAKEQAKQEAEQAKQAKIKADNARREQKRLEKELARATEELASVKK